MTRSVALIALAAASLAACNSAADDRAEAIAAFKLDNKQVVLMDAFAEGLKREGQGPFLGHSYASAGACYAARVNMPTRFDKIHADYVSDYMAIDQDFDGWFSARGVSKNASRIFFEEVDRASKLCRKDSRWRP